MSLDAFASVSTWRAGMAEQWGGDPLAEEPEKLDHLARFCAFAGLDPDALVSFCFLRKRDTGERFVSVARRAEQPQRDEVRCRWNAFALTPVQRHDQGGAESGGAGDDDQPQHLRLQPPRAGDAQRAAGHGAGECKRAFERTLAVEVPQQRRVAHAAPLEAISEGDVDGAAERQRHQAHDQRCGEAVPQRQAVGRQHTADHRPCRDLEVRSRTSPGSVSRGDVVPLMGSITGNGPPELIQPSGWPTSRSASSSSV